MEKVYFDMHMDKSISYVHNYPISYDTHQAYFIYGSKISAIFKVPDVCKMSRLLARFIKEEKS